MRRREERKEIMNKEQGMLNALWLMKGRLAFRGGFLYLYSASFGLILILLHYTFPYYLFHSSLALVPIGTVVGPQVVG